MYNNMTLKTLYHILYVYNIFWKFTRWNNFKTFFGITFFSLLISMYKRILLLQNNSINEIINFFSPNTLNLLYFNIRIVHTLYAQHTQSLTVHKMKGDFNCSGTEDNLDIVHGSCLPLLQRFSRVFSRVCSRALQWKKKEGGGRDDGEGCKHRHEHLYRNTESDCERFSRGRGFLPSSVLEKRVGQGSR